MVIEFFLSNMNLLISYLVFKKIYVKKSINSYLDYIIDGGERI